MYNSPEQIVKIKYKYKYKYKHNYKYNYKHIYIIIIIIEISYIYKCLQRPGNWALIILEFMICDFEAFLQKRQNTTIKSSTTVFFSYVGAPGV